MGSIHARHRLLIVLAIVGIIVLVVTREQVYINTEDSHGSLNNNENDQNYSFLQNRKHRHLILKLFSNGPLRRIGNQMFAYASLLGLSLRYNYTLAFMDDLPMFDYFNTSPIKKVNQTNLKTQIIHKAAPLASVYYPDILENVNDDADVMLSGYFLSYKYFEDISGFVQKEFRIKTSYMENAQISLASLTPSDKPRRIIGVHVRRGDMTDPGKARFGNRVAPASYFNKAMDYFRSKYDSVLFIVCSDDIPWAKDNLKSDDVVFSTNKDAIVDFALLTLCGDVIMSVGTFGWWAGWLARGEVVYYSRWYTEGSGVDHQRGSTEDRMPLHWTAMD